MKRSVSDCGHAFALKKRKAWCTAVGEPMNTMKCRKPLSEESPKPIIMISMNTYHLACAKGFALKCSFFLCVNAPY